MGRRPLPPSVGVSQPYGSNPGGFNPPGGHTGTDYAAPLGTDVIAVADARVLWADWAYNLPGGKYDYHLRWMYDKDFPGILVVMEHDDVLTSPAHLIRTDLNVGDTVRAGQIVAQSGDTGSASTGPHTHFEVIPKPFNWNTSTYGRTDPGPYTREPYQISSGQPSTGAWDKTPHTGPAWFPGAIRRPQGGAVTLDTSLPPRGTWHITADVAAGKPQPAQDAVGAYLEKMAYCPHLLWDPFTGRVIQYYPATVGSRALAAWNEDGRVHVQIEVLFSPGAVRQGRTYANLADTPLVGFAQLVQWLDSLGIPRAWPMGTPPPIGRSGSRDIATWNTRGGHYGHSQVPGNDHTDPGLFPDLSKVPRSTGAATTPAAPADLMEELIMATDAQIDKLFNDYYARNRGRAGTLAWAVSNDRDRGVNIEAKVAGLPASILQSTVARKGSGKGTKVSLAEVLAYDKDNNDGRRRAEAAAAETAAATRAEVAALRAELRELKALLAKTTTPDAPSTPAKGS